jgi:YgiT-type zinc finger domain-containing protein
MGRGPKDKETTAMKCHQCGFDMEAAVTNLPFKVKESTIIIVKDLPVLQCKNCNEYSLEDTVMEQVDRILEGADTSAELEVIKYAA